MKHFDKENQKVMLVVLQIKMLKNYHYHELVLNNRENTVKIFRSSHPEVFLRTGVLKICSNYLQENIHAEV